MLRKTIFPKKQGSPFFPREGKPSFRRQQQGKSFSPRREQFPRNSLSQTRPKMVHIHANCLQRQIFLINIHWENTVVGILIVNSGQEVRSGHLLEKRSLLTHRGNLPMCKDNFKSPRFYRRKALSKQRFSVAEQTMNRR